MKIDLTKLPVGEMVVVFLLAALGIGFLGAFLATDSGAGGGDNAAQASPTAAEGSPPPGGLALTLGDNFFEFQGQEEPTVPVPAGEEVTVQLTNEGSAPHNMHVATGGDFATDFCETGGDETCSDPDRITGGDTATITFTIAEPGAYNFRCDFHPREMTGTLQVQ